MTETSFQRQIKQLAQSSQQIEHHRVEGAKQQEDVTRHTAKLVANILEQLATEILQCDELLSRGEAPEGSISLFISYRKRTNSIRPSFRVQATCQCNIVDINLSDGHWTQVTGVLGSWADWTDQQKVYSGPPDLVTIRKSLESAFLTWYEAVMEAPDEPLDGQ